MVRMHLQYGRDCCRNLTVWRKYHIFKVRTQQSLIMSNEKLHLFLVFAFFVRPNVTSDGPTNGLSTTTTITFNKSWLYTTTDKILQKNTHVGFKG